MNSFTYKGKDFLLDGEKVIIHSGAIHYFRVPKEYWFDRLLKLKECGFNTVETYVAWNMHEKTEGEFDFSGNLDIARFLATAKELGLMAIVRPGPYICAEWEFGGFPWWLLKCDMKVRQSDERYFQKLSRYIDRLFKEIDPYLIDNGGNVIMMQVENEYGHFGSDKKYLTDLLGLYRTHTKSCLLFTSDSPQKELIEKGNVSGAIACENFGSHVEENFEKLSKIKPNQPLMCSEFWCGWFDHVYEEHHVRNAEDVVDSIKPFLENGYSFNFYMFHGGTNFGFMNGANNDIEYQPVVTSYDYSALLTESGDRTKAYYGVRDLLIKYGYPVPTLTAKDSEKIAYGKLTFKEKSKLIANLSLYKKVQNKTPLWFEDLDEGYGYVMYSAFVKGNGGKLKIEQLCDRANVFADGENVGIIDRCRKFDEIVLPNGNYRLDILVENMGRANFGDKIFEHKGLKRVFVSDKEIENFTMTLIPLDSAYGVKYESVKETDIKEENFTGFFRATLYTEKTADTFIKLNCFYKGVVFVNGINIGRYNNYTKTGEMAGDKMKTLYIPAPFLKKGENEIVVFETDKVKPLSGEGIVCELVDAPIL